MTLYEKNMECLKQMRPEMHEKLKSHITDTQSMLCGDALDGEKFLAVSKDNEIIPLNSTYHPSHEAERYVAQYDELSAETVLFMYGFSNGFIIRKALEKNCPVQSCIVYEPSVEIFVKVLEEYDVTDLIRNTELLIFIRKINDELLEKTLYDIMNYRNWKLFQFSIAPCYDRLFAKDCKEILKMFTNVHEYKHMEMNTLIRFAQSGVKNEVKAMKWFMNCHALEQYKNKFPEDMPCIIVAAGPSLEKNAEVLRRAKGRALIICVDTALPFLLKKDIIPDIACTIDAQKGTTYFMDTRLKDIPIMVSTDSDYRALEQIGDVKPIYIAAVNDFFQRLFKDKGYNVDYFDGGGSVATVSFQVAVGLGFHTIILIGQDLAFSDDKAHAGMGEVTKEDLDSKLMMVDAYNGGQILSRIDFKHYIDWYNLKIPELTDRLIINATEGGAKLKGAVQMTLNDVVNNYCNKCYDMDTLMNSGNHVWESYEEKKQLYDEIKKKYAEFKQLEKKVADGIGLAERAILLLKRGNYSLKELNKIDEKLKYLTNTIGTNEGTIILVKRMIDTEVTLTDDLHKAEANLDQESIRLYNKMKKYLSDMQKALEEILPLWTEVQKEINDVYHFEMDRA
mgnify:CR=1 FL=1